MPTLVVLRHHTTYHYDRSVALGPQTIRLCPTPHAHTPILSYALTVLPEPHTRHWFQDPMGNFLARVLFPEPTARFEITIELTADLAETNPFDFYLEPDAATWPFRYSTLLEQELTPYRAAEPIRPWLASLLTGLPLMKQPSVELLVTLNQLVRDRVSYVTRMEPGVQTPEQTLERGNGSCRDVAWLLVQVARNLGFAARFVSGYLIQLADTKRPVPGIEADGADLHAWVEVYLPGAGWIGFDATSGLIIGAGHIPLASSAHPASAAPVSGTIAASTVRFDIETSVTRLSAPSAYSTPLFGPGCSSNLPKNSDMAFTSP
jgi:transglutaminase-like putative cysteine protease